MAAGVGQTYGMPDQLQVFDPRQASVGLLHVDRALPQRVRRTVGAWCFLDHAGPVGVSAAGPGIGPHPHIGLQTVTWLLSGEILHRDSLGSEQTIRPGELNLMTAGHGVVHAEEHVGSSPIHLAQLWVAQPSETRDAPPAFEHHPDLPHVDLGGGTAVILVGALAGVHSPARRDTDHWGAEVEIWAASTVPLQPEHEHGVVVLDGVVEIDGRVLARSQVAYLAPGRDMVGLRPLPRARVLVLGGVPFPEPVVMWWNYVARDRDEISVAHAAWTARTDRFPVPHSKLGSVDVAPPPWTR